MDKSIVKCIGFDLPKRQDKPLTILGIDLKDS